MRTLYVADLDGTLLDRQGMLSEYTIHTVRKITDSDGLFTIATARSLQAANDLIWLLGIRLPSILMNGSMIFDTVNRSYVHASKIQLEAIPPLLEILEHHKICGFLYTLQAGQVFVYYRELRHNWDIIYHAHRAEMFEGRIYQVENLFEVACYNTPVYMLACGCYDTLFRAQRDLERLHGISAEVYCDEYNSFCFMDIFPSSATKGQAVLTMQKMMGAEEIVAFGDSFTDMQMLLGADRSYVPRNGIAAARNVATEVLGYAHQDSIAHFLAHEMGWE